MHPSQIYSQDEGLYESVEDLALGGPDRTWGNRPPAPFPFLGLPLTHLTLTGGARAHKGLGRPLNSADRGDAGDGIQEGAVVVGLGLPQLPLQEVILDGRMDGVPAGGPSVGGLRVLANGIPEGTCLPASRAHLCALPALSPPPSPPI